MFFFFVNRYVNDVKFNFDLEYFEIIWNRYSMERFKKKQS